MTAQFRASFDAVVTFSNGGSLTAQSFRVDLPSRDTSSSKIGMLFVASLGLLMTDTVTLHNVTIFEEQHKGTRGGPSAFAASPSHLVDLSHPTEHAVVVHAESSVSGLVDLPAIVIHTAGAGRAIDVGHVAAFTVRGCAVLLHTSGDQAGASYLTQAAAEWLADNGAALVGIDAPRLDAPNIDAASDRPAHSSLLDARIPVVVNLTGLAKLPPLGARFTAAPPVPLGVGLLPVRAYATVPGTQT